MIRNTIILICLTLAFAAVFWKGNWCWFTPEPAHRMSRAESMEYDRLPVYYIGRCISPDNQLNIFPDAFRRTHVTIPTTHHLCVAIKIDLRKEIHTLDMAGLLVHTKGTGLGSFDQLPINRVGPFRVIYIHDYLLAALLLAFPLLTLLNGPLRRHLRRRKNHCPICNYDLRASKEHRCPECGEPSRPGSLHTSHSS
jgi:hypothetical protein